MAKHDKEDGHDNDDDNDNPVMAGLKKVVYTTINPKSITKEEL